MSKLLKQLNDNQNKVADTNGIMKLQAWDYGIAQDLTNKKITATVANASGFLFDLDLVSNGTEIDLDFKNERLQKLTPDTYFLEIKVTDKDGDISVFPTEGYATFTINKNLHATEGALVPQITFETVLADVKTAMDEKVADYVKTIAKGDTGKDGVVDYSKTVNITGDQTVADTKTFSSAINGNLSGNASTADKLRTARTIGGVKFDGTANINLPGVNTQGNQDTTGNASSASKLLTARKINGTNFDGTSDIHVNAANDSSLVHTTGNETVAGDKTFTGQVAVSGTIDSAEKVYTRTIGSTSDILINYTRAGNVVTGRYTVAAAGTFTLTNNDGYKSPSEYSVNVISYNANAWFGRDNKFTASGASTGNFVFITNDPLPQN